MPKKRSGLPPVIFRTAFLSTDHLSSETCLLMDDWSAGIDLTRAEYSDAPIFIGPTETGWYVAVPDAPRKEIPRDLWRCMQYARKHRCPRIQFDADGDVVDDLPSLGGPSGRKPA